MTAQGPLRLHHLSTQLAELLMTAALCAQELQHAIEAELGGDGNGPACDPAADPPGPAGRPLVDRATLSVTWQGRSVQLGHTRGFRLLECLARRPNRYVTHVDLIRDVWDDNDELSTDTIRSVVSQLRCKLRAHGMDGLATAITGHCGRYVRKVQPARPAVVA